MRYRSVKGRMPDDLGLKWPGNRSSPQRAAIVAFGAGRGLVRSTRRNPRVRCRTARPDRGTDGADPRRSARGRGPSQTKPCVNGYRAKKIGVAANSTVRGCLTCARVAAPTSPMIPLVMKSTSGEKHMRGYSRSMTVRHEAARPGAIQPRRLPAGRPARHHRYRFEWQNRSSCHAAPPGCTAVKQAPSGRRPSGRTSFDGPCTISSRTKPSVSP